MDRPTPADPRRWPERLEGEERLDSVAEPLAEKVRSAVDAAGARRLLSGEWLGHALHPALTDLPIGFFTSAMLFDLTGRRGRWAADACIVGGLLTVPAAAATGLSDWSELDTESRRVGLVHAAANTTGTVLYTASLVARLRGRRIRGVALGLLGAGALTVGGYLGGHLVLRKGAGVTSEEAPDVVGWDERLAVPALEGGPVSL